ncbi:hypothetical protein EGW08_003637 [Elysia chlorotica]|uniref:SET domain-containing protein n=1 Tax=Elysia chlorotica TaxID=188477 RepID=A0A433U478_ELYCH|nr:hypothetical protein EGW08_003637 [Elysia chlorotica]
MSVVLRVGAVKPIENQELHYGSGDEASTSYTDADVLDMPLPEHTYQRPLPPTTLPSQSTTGYIGLPYQDHNYGMPPPPSPPRPASPRPPSPFEDNGMVQIEEEVKTTPPVSVVEEVVEDSITRCICGYLHDDGYMICCDRCSVWQHIDCMGVERNNIPDSYFCELCQPRVLDAVKAKAMQKRKREELAARNVLSDSSATDTDPEEAANALASMGKKLPASKKKSLKQKHAKAKEKPPLKLKIRKALAQKVKKPGKKEKENITSPKPDKKHMKLPAGQRGKIGKEKTRISLTLEDMTGDPWNSNLSPWVDSYVHANENHYSPSVRDLSSNISMASQKVDISSIMPDELLGCLTCVAEVKKNRKGLRALQQIPAGQAIIEYKGKVMLRHDYDKEHVNSLKKFQPFVLFYSQLDIDLCVDARTYGNEARFVRRSCTPNAEVKHILSRGKLYFIILSKKDIMCDFEVTIPFDYNYQDCSYCIECACKKNNCVVSKHWKKRKNSQKAPQQKEYGVKRKRQNSGMEPLNTGGIDQACMSPPLLSPGKHSLPTNVPSPSKIVSPVKLSNVSTLLAASALLDGKLDLANSLDLEDSDPSQQNLPMVQYKPATSSRRSSKLVEETVKEEKIPYGSLTPTKEKSNKVKETAKSKGKEKDGKISLHHTTEVKKERRLSSRRQSQDDMEDTTDHKTDSSTSAHLSGSELDESSASYSENQKKMTREERKLDAIMKVFEKMEKREERRKEAMARGDQGTKRCSVDSKIQKKEDGTPHSKSNSQDGSSDMYIKEELPGTGMSDTEKSTEVRVEEANNPGNQQRPPSKEIKIEKMEDLVKSESIADVNSSGALPSGALPCGPPSHESRLGSMDSSKVNRRPGKRKRRRSRVHSATMTSDTASVSTEEGNSNSSFPVASLSVPVTPAATPVSTPLPTEDNDAGAFIYVKTKKHLFDEWSHKHDDETTKQEKFVECLPNPHVNTMDHLQRRNSQSSGVGYRGSETSGGSAKKRWLRQAMHEVPAPVAFHHSLSVSTDSGSASPIHGSSSPNPGTGLGSPGAGSSLDFVTPLKKRRLLRESLSSEVTTSPSAGILAESFATNGVGGISTKTNGVKHVLPTIRHSTDDRMFLHKGYAQKNGFREAILLSEGNEPKTSNSMTSINQLGPERQGSQFEQVVDIDNTWRGDTRLNGVAEGLHASTSNSLPQPSSSTSFPFKFRGLLERSEILKEKETVSTASSPRNLQNSSPLVNSVLSSSSPSKQENMELDRPVSMPPVIVVNRNVYNGVNSLMGEDRRETGVTAKSIMNEDSPATVRIDLNSHEMEPPSSLSDTSNNVVVNLDDSLFSVSLHKEHQDMAECQVNSSEDVDLYPSTRHQGRVSVNICDNPCTNANNTDCRDGNRGGVVSQAFLEKGPHTDTADLVHSSQAVVSACNDFKNLEPISSGSVSKDNNSIDAMASPGSSSSLAHEPSDGISSSGQACMPRVVVELSSVCDSVNNSTEDNAGWTQERASLRAAPVEAVESSQCDAREEAPNVHSNESSKCDSVQNGQTYPLGIMFRTDSNRDVEIADSNVAESSSIDPRPLFAVSSVSMENGVDSTCSEAKQATAETSESPAAQYSFCDSNSDLNTVNNRSRQRSSVTSDDSCVESMSVSSSEAFTSKKNDHCGNDNEVFSSVSCETLQPSTDLECPKPEQESPQDQVIESSSSLSVHVMGCLTNLQQPQTTSSGPVSLPSTSSPSSCLPSSSHASFSSSSTILTVVDTNCSPGSPSSSDLHSTHTFAECSSANSSQGAATSPISSSMEATPVVKKKVSLREYRQRLKEKPRSSSETKTSTSPSASAALTSSVSTPITHHKLSTTLSLYLQGSSPNSSFSTSPSKGSALPTSSNHAAKKGRMPTLATLPLFKSSEPKREEKKKPKPKPEKQLSLTERLRLEFGLDDVDDSSKKKRTETTDVSPSNGIEDSNAPPPPPPPLTAAYPAASSGGARYGISSARPSQGQFSGSSTQLLNGIRSGHFQQQPQPQQQQATISSTSLSLAPLMGGSVRHPCSGSAAIDQHHAQQASKSKLPPPPPPRAFMGPPHHSSSTTFKAGFHHNLHQTQSSLTPSSSPSMPPSTSALGLLHNQVPPPSIAWSSGAGVAPNSTGHHAMLSQPTAGSSVPHGLPPPHMQHINQRQQLPQQQPCPAQVQVHPKTVVTGNVVPDDRPPPPPPPRLHHHHQSSASSLSSHRFHNHQTSGGKHKNNMAAVSSSSNSSSSSSSCYPDNRNRY